MFIQRIKGATTRQLAMSFSVQTVPQQEADAQAEETNQQLYQRFTDLVSSLPSSDGLSLQRLYLHGQGWRAGQMPMVGAMVAGARFAARPTDVVLASLPKTGTTWTEALLYATVRRREHPPDAADHPFHSFGPHECVQNLEYQIYYTCGRVPDIGDLPDPRLFSTHVPFAALPGSVAGGGCKVVYVCRDPKDTLVSLWHFINKFRAKEGMALLSAEVAADMFCAGESSFGPYWEHVLGYWRAHLARPDWVLFFRYEEMVRDPAAHVRRLAEFVGLPFGGAGEDGTADAIVRLCAFEHMCGLEATKSGRTVMGAISLENSIFFRRGVVGDWVNHLSPETARRIDDITRSKFEGSGLTV
ncbi:cytosolic sulfotransferase 14 [Setaria italica]|nr:cytosolic sulfotransferase 14 [Setaria italica]